MYCSFMETYTRQLNHSNPLVGASTRHGSLQAKHKLHPSMLCLATKVAQGCLSYIHDHNRFLVLCHLVCLEVYVPEKPPHVPTIFNPIHLCVHEWHIDDVHSWMDAGYASLSNAVRSRWPCCFHPLRQHFPPSRKSHREYVRCYSTLRPPLSL